MRFYCIVMSFPLLCVHRRPMRRPTRIHGHRHHHAVAAKSSVVPGVRNYSAFLMRNCCFSASALWLEPLAKTFFSRSITIFRHATLQTGSPVARPSSIFPCTFFVFPFSIHRIALPRR